MKASWKNILDELTTTVTGTSQATGYDLYRLYDRFMGRQWKATSTSTQTILVNQSSNPLPVKDLILPSGHLLSGCTLAWQYSSDNVSWYDAITPWVQSGSGEIKKSMTSSLTRNYWRLVISGASVAPQVGEVWMGVIRTFTAGMADGASYKLEDITITQQSLYAKTPTFVNLGEPKYYLNGKTVPIELGERSYFEEWFSTCGGYKPFYFEDHDGHAYFAYFISRPEFIEGLGYCEARLELQQVW